MPLKSRRPALDLRITTTIFLLLVFMVTGVSAEENGTAIYRFSDQPIKRDFDLPAWFKPGFLDLRQDTVEARDAGKLGLIVYFGQVNCVYCEKLLKLNFGIQTDIVAYTRRYFDVVAVDIWGALKVRTPWGEVLTEKQYADHEKTNFTPSLVFYNTQGQKIFRLRGYYPPYQFRAALDYVVGGWYRSENFRTYLERADPPLIFDENELSSSELFAAPPYWLARHAAPATRPLVVFFEQPRCHACDVLHGELLFNQPLYDNLAKMEAVQFDMWQDTPLVTPAGKRTTARTWADELGLFYTPTLIFFDERGQEIIRVDSVVQQYRLSKVVKYVLSKGYLEYPHFQRWYTAQERRKN